LAEQGIPRAVVSLEVLRHGLWAPGDLSWDPPSGGSMTGTSAVDTATAAADGAADTVADCAAETAAADGARAPDTAAADSSITTQVHVLSMASWRLVNFNSRTMCRGFEVLLYSRYISIYSIYIYIYIYQSCMVVAASITLCKCRCGSPGWLGAPGAGTYCLPRSSRAPMMTAHT
jgi:hypothetical protein